ncbi:MAG: 50S ribosomal protein L30 [Armatimonadetes bacterium]|nr:50S ribosomal protein L30 [Armatimonadota bacterium]
MLKITLVKSTISETPRNRATVHALGLRKTNRSVVQEDTPVIRGMIHHVKHLLKVEEAEGATKVRRRQGKKAAGAAAPKPAKPAKAEPKAEAAEQETQAEKPAKAAPAKPAAKKAPAKKKES